MMNQPHNKQEAYQIQKVVKAWEDQKWLYPGSQSSLTVILIPKEILPRWIKKMLLPTIEQKKRE